MSNYAHTDFSRWFYDNRKTLQDAVKYRSPGARSTVEDIFKSLEMQWAHKRPKIVVLPELSFTLCNATSDTQSQRLSQGQSLSQSRSFTPNATKHRVIRADEGVYSGISLNLTMQSGNQSESLINTVTPLQLAASTLPLVSTQTRAETDTSGDNAGQENLFSLLFSVVPSQRAPFVFDPSRSTVLPLTTSTITDHVRVSKCPRSLDSDMQSCADDRDCTGIVIPLDELHSTRVANTTKMQEAMAAEREHLNWIRTTFPVNDVSTDFTFKLLSSANESDTKILSKESPRLNLPGTTKVNCSFYCVRKSALIVATVTRIIE